MSSTANRPPSPAERSRLPVRADAIRLLSLCLLVSGCAVYSPPPPVVERAPPPPLPPPMVDPTPTPIPSPAPAPVPVPEPPPAAPRGDPATLALLAQSDRAVQRGEMDEAIAYVERALRMNGQDVELWLRLAELQLLAARPQHAEQLAQRAITLAGSRLDWQRRGWLIVADAHEARGRHEEAQQIRLQWRTYRG